MQAGDATWHYGYTIHRAPGNHSDQMREVMTIIYMADGTKIMEPCHKWQISDRSNWLMNGPVGGPAASALNPKVL